ncbi:MAG: protease HtpX, partial [Kiritimatiellaeota bacterium]|nr:protease HtpX [Kiritimatiellota bacterium]
MKRIFLFIATNIAVMLVLSIVWSVLSPMLGFSGEYAHLLVFSAVFGFGGALISLMMSKTIAKLSVGAKVINPKNPPNEQAAWICNTVERLAQRAGIKMPEVAIYHGSPNAFATGASKNNALVAVSDGLLGAMNRMEVEAVLGHEIAHVANGDMVTLTLVQGVMNTFVIFLSRVIGFAVDKKLGQKRGRGIGYFLTYMVCQIVFGIIAGMVVASVSRKREFKADAGSAEYLNSSAPMISALRRLGGIAGEPLPDSLNAFGISGIRRRRPLFATHPPIEARIEALQNPVSHGGGGSYM